MSRFERTYSRDLLSSFHRSRTLGIKRLRVAQLVRPPGDSRDCSSMMWEDIWAQGTETTAGEGALLIWPGKYKCPIRLKLDTIFIFHSWPAPTLNGLLNLKMRESYQSIPKEIHTHFWKKEAHYQCLRLPLKYTLQGQAQITKHLSCWHGSHFHKTQEVKTKFDQQKVNMHGILRMNLQSLKQS